MKSLVFVSVLMVCLGGCVGVAFRMPESKSTTGGGVEEPTRRAAYQRYTDTVKTGVTREWCGVTVWAVIVPVPLKLPVCESFRETSYDKDAYGQRVPVLYTSQSMSSSFYACGPGMLLAPIAHGYRGNAFCGSFPD